MRYASACLAAMIMLGAMAPAVAAPPDAQAATSSADSLPSAIALRVAEVVASNHLKLDERGAVVGGQKTVYLRLAVSAEPGTVAPVKVQVNQMGRATLDTGEVLDKYTFSYLWLTTRIINKHAQDQGKTDDRDMTAQIYLSKGISHAATKIVEMSGTADVHYALGEPIEVVYSPWTKALEKPVVLPSLKAVSVSFFAQNRGDQEWRLTLSTSSEHGYHIAGIAFEDAAGTPVAVQNYHVSFDLPHAQHVYKFRKLPEDAVIRLYLHPKVEKVVVPFTLRDIPLVPPSTGDHLLE